MVMEIDLILRLQVMSIVWPQGCLPPVRSPPKILPDTQSGDVVLCFVFFTFLNLRNSHACFPTAYETTSPHTQCLSIRETLE